jgi:hypothetical protein
MARAEPGANSRSEAEDSLPRLRKIDVLDYSSGIGALGLIRWILAMIRSLSLRSVDCASRRRR